MSTGKEIISIGDPEGVSMLLPESCGRDFNLASLAHIPQAYAEFKLPMSLNMVHSVCPSTFRAIFSTRKDTRRGRDAYVYELSTIKFWNGSISFQPRLRCRVTLVTWTRSDCATIIHLGYKIKTNHHHHNKHRPRRSPVLSVTQQSLFICP
jgi:hypothetical protein